MKKTTRTIGIVMGAVLVLVLVGGLVAAAGAGVLATIGNDGKVSSGSQTFATSGSAIVMKSSDLRRPDAVADIVGDPRVQHSTPIAWSLFGGGILLALSGVAVMLSARASAPSPRHSPAYSAAR